jgi:hypothetical protein
LDLNIVRTHAPTREVSTKIVCSLTHLKVLIYFADDSSPLLPPHLNPSLRPAIRRNPSPTSPSHGAPGLRLRWQLRRWRQDPPPPSLPRCRRLSLRAPRPGFGADRGGGFAGRRVVLPDHHRRRLAPPPFLIPQAAASTHCAVPPAAATAHRAGPAAAAGAARGAAFARLAARTAPRGARRAALVAASTVRFVSSALSFACL